MTAGFRELPVTLAHGQRAGSWSQERRDPFDRMLAALSLLADLPLVARDPVFRALAVATVWRHGLVGGVAGPGIARQSAPLY